eukprot:9385877-Alexandrium_andersonii.AAC.1
MTPWAVRVGIGANKRRRVYPSGSFGDHFEAVPEPAQFKLRLREAILPRVLAIWSQAWQTWPVGRAETAVSSGWA